jgi:hypothetical protein
MYTYIFTDGASVLTPESIPIGTVARSFFTFTAALFSATCMLLAIGDFTTHDFVPAYSLEEGFLKWIPGVPGDEPKRFPHALVKRDLLHAQPGLTEDKGIINYARDI